MMFQMLGQAAARPIPILGIVENMSGEVFGTGGGEQAARSMDIPFLGRVDLDPAVRAAGDAGLPVLLSDPQSASA